MGGFFGAIAKRDIKYDVFFGVDYHSHLGTRRAGMIIHDEVDGFQRQIHSIDNTPFRTKFEKDLVKFHGNMGIGCISDADPQPLMVRSHIGVYAISCIGAINNADELVDEYCRKTGHQFMAMSSGKVNMVELLAALINQKEKLVDGIRHAQEKIKGSATILIMTKDRLIAARDPMGRLPVLVGKHARDGYCVSFESFAYIKQDYEDCYELGPGEIVEITADGFETISPAGQEMKICTFLWTYYGYPTACYEGQNVEMVRYRNGAIMARDDAKRYPDMDVDYVCGMPDSGIPHAMGYANETHKALARPFIKYTPTWLRSFTPPNQEMRNQVAKMKQIHVPEPFHRIHIFGQVTRLTGSESQNDTNPAFCHLVYLQKPLSTNDLRNSVSPCRIISIRFVHFAIHNQEWPMCVIIASMKLFRFRRLISRTLSPTTTLSSRTSVTWVRLTR